MSTYMTEEEQIEQIKRVWRKYQNHITIALSIVLLSVAVVRFWNWHVEKTLSEASSLYERMQNEFQKNDTNRVQSYANLIVKNYSGTVYHDAANLTLAKIFSEQKSYEVAQKRLEAIQQKSKIKVFSDLAALRLIRLQIEQKKYDAALNALQNMSDSAFIAIVQELRGDILSAKGDLSNAYQAYSEATDAFEKEGINNPFLEMKKVNTHVLS